MKYIYSVTIVFLLILIAALPGCNSNKEKTEQAPLKNSGKPTAPLQKEGAVVASPRDITDVTPLKDRVLTLFKGAEFSTIYKEASAGFRDVGPEQQFLEMWQQQRMDTGAFKDAKEVSHTIRPADKFLVFIYDVNYENTHKALRLTFGRSKKGVMELTGINQSDLPIAGK